MYSRKSLGAQQFDARDNDCLECACQAKQLVMHLLTLSLLIHFRGLFWWKFNAEVEWLGRDVADASEKGQEKAFVRCQS